MCLFNFWNYDAIEYTRMDDDCSFVLSSKFKEVKGEGLTCKMSQKLHLNTFL